MRHRVITVPGLPRRTITMVPIILISMLSYCPCSPCGTGTGLRVGDWGNHLRTGGVGGTCGDLWLCARVCVPVANCLAAGVSSHSLFLFALLRLFLNVCVCVCVCVCVTPIFFEANR